MVSISVDSVDFYQPVGNGGCDGLELAKPLCLPAENSDGYFVSGPCAEVRSCYRARRFTHAYLLCICSYHKFLLNLGGGKR